MARVVDLFAGCGGLSKGFEDAGFELVGAFENWGPAVECYSLNFDHPVFQTDLSDVDAACEQIQSLKPDIIIGGPPCQDFSHAGKRIEAERASLTESYALIIEKCKPSIFLMENVDRSQKSEAFKKAEAIFRRAGYGLTKRVLTASYCGVPQRRKRFFCIGVLGGEDDALDTILTNHLSEKEMTVRDYFGDQLDIEYYYRHPRNYNRRGIFSIDEPAPTMRGVNRPVPKGYPGHPKDAAPVNDSIRALTTLERACIQTFPADYKWVGSKTDCEQMVGNAVPVNLGKYVASAISEYQSSLLSCATTAQKDRFKSWLEDSKGLSNKSACDVVSRLNRARSIRPIEESANLERYLFDLSMTDEYKATSSSVKSQMKRAVKLFFEYAA